MNEGSEHSSQECNLWLWLKDSQLTRSRQHGPLGEVQGSSFHQALPADLTLQPEPLGSQHQLLTAVLVLKGKKEMRAQSVECPNMCFFCLLCF